MTQLQTKKALDYERFVEVLHRILSLKHVSILFILARSLLRSLEAMAIMTKIKWVYRELGLDSCKSCLLSLMEIS